MFEKYVERLLNRYLAPYVDGISKDNVDLLKGDLVLQNLTVKKEAFEFLKSSGILLHAGNIKRIHLKIPWRSLTQGKISVELDSIAVDVGRIQGAIPNETEILADFRKDKAAQVESKVARILELKEITESLKEQTSSFGARFAHRIIQNLKVDISSVAVRLVDLKQDVLVGFLLGSLAVHTVGTVVDDPAKNILRKQVDVEDLAAFCKVGKQPLHYILEPTVLRLGVDNMASKLAVKLELLHEKEIGGMLSLSKTAMTRLIVAVQEMSAWQEYLSSIVMAQCQHIKVDAESLKGATHDEYVKMWRRKCMKQMTMADDKSSNIAIKEQAGDDNVELQAMEDAVPARHLALWRIEVKDQLKTAEEQAPRKRGGWWPFASQSTQANLLSVDDWDDIKKKVEKEQASLADLDDLQTKELVIELKQFGALLFDDVQLEANMPEEPGEGRVRFASRSSLFEVGRDSRSDTQSMMSMVSDRMPRWIQYKDLCKHLDHDNYKDRILHSFSVTVANVLAKANLETIIVDDRERTEWSFSAVLGCAKVCCDHSDVLQFTHTQEENNRMGPAQTGAVGATVRGAKATSRKVLDNVYLHSRVQDDGSDLITTRLILPPVICNISPSTLKMGLDLVNFDLPPPPVFGKTESDDEASNSDDDDTGKVLALSHESELEAGAADQDLGFAPVTSKSASKRPRKSTANANISDWKEEEQERIRDNVNHEIERFKEGALKFEITISIAAPQVTIMVDDFSSIRVNFGFLKCVSDDEMMADRFNVGIDLKETHIMCTVEEPGLSKKVFPVLEPISLSVTLKGEPSSQGGPPAGAAKQQDGLKVTADVMLEKLQLKVHPAAMHLFLRLPLVYSMLVGAEREGEQEQGRADADASMTLTQAVVGFSDKQAQDAIKMEDRSTSRASLSAETSPADFFLDASVAVELVRLGVFDINGVEVAHTDVVELAANVKSGPVEISSTMSLRHILVEVEGQPLVYMKEAHTREKMQRVINLQRLQRVLGKQDTDHGNDVTEDVIAPADNGMPEQAPDQKQGVETLKASHGIAVEILIPMKDTPMTPTSVDVDICPIVISWQKRRVGALYSVAMSCMLPAPVNARKSLQSTRRPTLTSPERTSLSKERLSSWDGTRVKTQSDASNAIVQDDVKRDEQKEQSKSVAVSGLAADAALPPLNASANSETAAACLAVDILFGGLAIELNVAEEDEMQLSPAWRGIRNAPLIYFNAHGVKVHYEAYEGEESSGQAVLQEVAIEYDGQRIAAPWQVDKPLLEFDFCTYNTGKHGDPVYSLCLKGLVRSVSLVFFLKHMDSLMAYLTDNILGALVTAAAAQAAEAVQQQVEAKILLWNIVVESPVIYVSRDIEVLRHSPSWGVVECSLPYVPPKEDFKHPTPMVASFAQCMILRPGTIQARCQYELDTWAMRIHVGFKDCVINITDSEGYAVGPVCDLFNWELTIRPTGDEIMHVAVGLHFFPINLNLSQAQFILILNTLNENLAYSRYFPTEAARAPEGASAAALPQFAAQYIEDGVSDEDSSAAESSESEPAAFEFMRMNVRMEFESYAITVGYSSPGKCSTADSQRTPLFRVGATDTRMTFDAVSYYAGAGMLFSFGFFVDNIYADDLRPDTFRTCCHDRVLVCRTESSSYTAAGNSDSWRLVVDRDQGKEPWLPEQVALQVMFTKTTDSSMVMILNVVQPRLFLVIQMIMDTVFIVVDAFMASTLLTFDDTPLPSKEEELQVDRESPSLPLVINFKFRIEGLTLYLMTKCEQPSAPLIEVMASAFVEFDYSTDGSPVKIHEVDVYDVTISRSEETGEGSVSEEGQLSATGKARSTVRLVHISRVITVGYVAMPPRLQLNFGVHVLPVSLRLSTRDVPYLLAAAASIGSDGEPLLGVFSLEQRRVATSEGVCSCGAKLAIHEVFCRKCGNKRGSILDDLLVDKKDTPEKKHSCVANHVPGRPTATSTAAALHYNSASASSLGMLKLRAISVQGIRAPGARVKRDEEVWVTADLEGFEMSFLLQWGVTSEIIVPAKNQGLKFFGATETGLEVSEEGISLQLKLWRGAPHEEPECLGVLSFPVGLCVGDGLQCCRQMRPTSAQHSMLAAREDLPAIELEFEAHFKESQLSIEQKATRDTTLLEFSEPQETLEDFLKPMESLADFVEEPVPQLPPSSSRKSAWRNTTQRTSRAPRSSATPQASTADAPFSARVSLSFHGIEALFLDDCQAKVLPVLRFFLMAQSKIGSDNAPVETLDKHILHDALGAEGAGGMHMHVNPWENDMVQHKGFSLRIEDCTVSLQYLNSRGGNWEPFLEQWTFDFFFDAGSEHEAEGVRFDETKSSSQFQAALEVKLVSFMPLLVNVTPQLFSLVSWLLNNAETYMAEFRGEEGQDTIGPAKHTDLSDARYRLLNLSGKPMNIVLFRPRSEEEQLVHAEVFDGGTTSKSCLTDSMRAAGDSFLSKQTPKSNASFSTPKSNASSKSVAAESKSTQLRWCEFQSCEKEIDLDPLLGNRTAEQWRELADEAVTCAVEIANDIVIEVPRLPGTINSVENDMEIDHDAAVTSTFTSSFSGKVSFGVNPESEAKRAILSLSSASESILPLESNPSGLPIYAACEVLAPHPSHHLLVVSSGLRVFNHTGRAFQVFYRADETILPFGSADDDEEDAVLAAPFHILPLKIAMPTEIASALQIQPASNRLEGNAMQEFAAEEMIAHQFSSARTLSGGEQEEKTADSQWLKPQCFCAAPLEVAAFTTSVQLGLPGSKHKSNPIALETEDAQGGSRHEEVLINDRTHKLRFHAYVIHAPEHSIVKTVSVHIYTPLRLINATPVKLQFVFEAPSTEKTPPQWGNSPGTMKKTKKFSAVGVSLSSFAYGQKVKRFVVDLDPLSDCDLPPDIDPSEPYGVTIMITNTSHEMSTEIMHPSPPVPRIFDSNYGTPEELVAVPLGENEIDKQGEEALMLTISRGLICSVTCQRWLVDRTGLGLRVIHSLQLPTETSLALPHLGNDITLLSPIYQKWMRTNFPEMKRMQYHLAVPSNEVHGWAAVGRAKLPDTSEGVTYASLSEPLSEAADGLGHYPVHVCLHAEALSLELTFGTPCHIISVLPQVVIYNKLADDGIDVRAVGDPCTEMLVESQESAQFLRWRPIKNPKHIYDRSKLHLEFRPRQLQADANWSGPIKVSSKSCSSRSVVFSAVRQDVKLPNMLRMYMVEVAEQDGVLCFSVTRGSRCELRNFSRLVQEVAITPRRPDGMRQRNAPREETFVARLCETVEFAWPSQGSELELDVMLLWIKAARATGSNSEKFVIPDVYKPAKFKRPTPRGWVHVVVRTGCTDDITWIQVQDLHNIVQMPSATSLAGTFVRALGLDADTQKAQNLAQVKLGVSLSGIGISLISEVHERELMYAEVQQVGLLVGVWDDRWSLEVWVSDVQVDCQLLDFKDNPVVLANRGENNLPFLQIRVSQRLPISRYGMSFEQVGVQTDCMEVDLNDIFLLDVVSTLSKLSDLVSSSQGVTREQLSLWRSNPLAGSLESPPSLPMQVSINELFFLGLEVHLWAKISLSKLPAAARKPLQLLTAGSDSFCVDGATLRMSPEVFDGIQGAAPRVITTLVERYYWSFLISVGSVLGRSSLFTLPALPVKWGQRVVTHSMRAMDFFIHRAADVFEILTLDEQYIRRKKREHQQRLRDITGLRSGLSTAALHLGSGLLHIVDIVREPIAGAQNNGLTGFVTGIGRGILSTVVKPVIEVGFSARAITRAVRVKVRSSQQRKARRVTMRRRPPRVTYGAGGIREYDEAAALLTLEVATAPPVPGSSQKDLLAIEQAKFGITDHVVVERVGATPHIRHLLLLVTPFQLLLVVLDSRGIAVRWSVPLTSFRGARASSHGVVVWEEAPAAGESTSRLVGHQVPCTDAVIISKIFWTLQDVQAKGISAGGMTQRLDMSKQPGKEPETRWEKIRRGISEALLPTQKK